MRCAYVHVPGIAVGDGIAETIDVDYFAVPMEFAVKQYSFSFWFRW